MQKPKSRKSGNSANPTMDTEPLLKLKGLPGLSDYLHFHKSRVVGGDEIKKRILVNEWRQANDHYHELETAEAGAAETIECFALPKNLQPLKRALVADQYFKQSFLELPYAVKMVELGKLMASQHSVGTGFAAGIAKRLGKRPTAGALFEFCLPLKRSSPDIAVQRLSDSRYIFTSRSTDFRDHDAKIAGAADLGFVSSFGPVETGIVIPIGFGSNFLSAIESEKRIVLQNGYHRAFALMSLGITHAPMIVQKVTRTDELDLAASSEVADNAAFYFRSKRPPLLRDFLDDRLAKKVDIYALETRVEVELKVTNTTGTIKRAA